MEDVGEGRRGGEGEGSGFVDFESGDEEGGEGWVGGAEEEADAGVGKGPVSFQYGKMGEAERREGSRRFTSYVADEGKERTSRKGVRAEFYKIRLSPAQKKGTYSSCVDDAEVRCRSQAGAHSATPGSLRTPRQQLQVDMRSPHSSHAM